MAVTYEQVMGRHDVTIPAHLEAQAEVPILAGMQRQGDVIVLPSRAGKDRGQLVGREGVAVVRGEATSNTHLLVADGPVWWRPVGRGFDCGIMVVEKNAAAYLLHPEHGAQGLAPGCYRIRRQREQADVIRRVAD